MILGILVRILILDERINAPGGKSECHFCQCVALSGAKQNCKESIGFVIPLGHKAPTRFLKLYSIESEEHILVK